MDNPKYIQVMRQVASDFDGISHELFQVASDLERMDQYNPQQKLFSLVRSAEVSSVTLRNLTARTVRDDMAPFYCEVADLLGIKVEETHDWLKISVPAILPKRNQRDNQAFLTRPLRYAIMDYLKENPMERFGSCAICIVHNYDAALGKRRIHQVVIGSTMSVAQRLCHSAKAFGNKYFVVSTFFAQCLFLTNNPDGDSLSGSRKEALRPDHRHPLL